MASTITLQDTIYWAQPFMGYIPLSIGTNNEPALTSANTVLQTLLSPPFRWRWNRAVSSSNIAANASNIIATLSNFGWLEKAQIGGFDCEIKYEPLTSPVEKGRPSFIAVDLDNDAGQITFDVQPTADQTYPYTFVYQEAPPLMTGLTSTWGPIPDYLGYLYNWGFLALMLESVDSTRSMNARRIFVASALSVAEGLKEADRNIFISTWLGQDAATASILQSSALGNQARGI